MFFAHTAVSIFRFRTPQRKKLPLRLINNASLYQVAPLLRGEQLPTNSRKAWLSAQASALRSAQASALRSAQASALRSAQAVAARWLSEPVAARWLFEPVAVALP
jgi:hypothetical protein